MEQNSRVKNIKEKFEVLKINSENLVVVGKGDKCTGNGVLIESCKPSIASSTSRSNIKRTPAFRREKSAQSLDTASHVNKHVSLVDNRVKQFSKLQNDPCTTSISLPKCLNHLCTENAVTDNKGNNSCHINHVVKGNNLLNYSSNVKKKELEKHANVNKSPVKEEPPFSDTIRRVLKSPLPAGPPPKKPPRTFMSNKNSEVLKLPEKRVMKEDFKVPSGTLVTAVSSGTSNRVVPAKPLRSKTELEIMLKKIENASLKHQRRFSPCLGSRKEHNVEMKSFGIPNSSSKPENDDVYDKSSVSCFGSLQLSNCIPEDNIYAEPANPQSTFFIETPSESKGGDKQNGFPENHTYDEVGNPVLHDIKSEENTTRSLYYMSTPIDSLINQLFDKQTLSTSSDEKRTNAVMEKDASGNQLMKMADDKVRCWFNETYSRPWSRLSDDSSDNESVGSAEDATSSAGHAHIVSESVHEQIVKERKGYVKRVATRALSRDHSMGVLRCKRVFECVILVGVDVNSKEEKLPYIKMKYPPEAIVPGGVENICFPDVYRWNEPEAEQQQPENDESCYTMILTDESGQRKYGYCKMVKPEGATKPLPLAYCILSQHRATTFYYSILKELEARHGQTDHTDFIVALYAIDFPFRGHAIRIPEPISSESESEKAEFLLRRPLDNRTEDLELTKALAYMKPNVFLQTFSTLLIERKVILLSTSVRKLSVCIDGLQMALLPLQWQHVLISVVPSSVISVTDICQAPTPYCIGLLKPRDQNQFTVLPPFDSLQQVIVVDVDQCKIIHKMGDENSILPYRLFKGLKNALQNARNNSSDNRLYNLMAFEAFMRLFVEVIGHYRHYIIYSEHTRKRMFQKEAFIRGALSKSVRLFLEWFTETAMFTSFIRSRLYPGPESRGLFEQRCNEFNEEIERLKCLKNNGKSGNKAVIKQIGDRIKDWTFT